MSHPEWELVSNIDESSYILGRNIEGIVFVILFAFWLLLFAKYVHKKSQLTAYLSIAYGGALITIFLTFLEKVLVTSGIVTYLVIMYKIKIGLIGVYGTLVLGLFYVLFVYEVFLRTYKWGAKFLKFSKILTVILTLYNSIVILFIPTDEALLNLLSIPIYACYIFILLPTFVSTGVLGIRIGYRIEADSYENYLGKISIYCIGGSGWSLLFFFITMIVDIAVIPDAMSIFYFISWFFLGLSFMFSYIGFEQPTFMKTLLEKRYQSKIGKNSNKI